jgi:DNA-binding NarL/FixJ family response regulator
MPEEFADATVSFKPDLVIIDEQLPADDMQAWARVITGLSPETRVLDLSIHSDESRRLELSAHGYLREPFKPTAFLEEVRRVLAADPTPLVDV